VSIVGRAGVELSAWLSVGAVVTPNSPFLTRPFFLCIHFHYLKHGRARRRTTQEESHEIPKGLPHMQEATYSLRRDVPSMSKLHQAQLQV
jgi:hypothetical protein